MKCIIKYVLWLYICIIILPIAASSHSGGTDANGGHWDRSTGKYHYHHGYSAHDHYDMNGDGVEDCPYNFVDKTGYNSSSSTNRTNSSNRYSYDDDIPPETVTVYRDREVIKEIPYIPVWIKWVTGFLGFLIFVLFVSNKKQKADIAYWKKQYHEGLASEKKTAEAALEKQQNVYDAHLKIYKDKLNTVISDHQAELNEVESRFAESKNSAEVALRYDIRQLEFNLSQVLGSEYLYVLSGAPDGDSLDSQGYPQESNRRNFKWGEKYTFLITPGSTLPFKYHKPTCRFGHEQVNAYQIRGSVGYIPCKHCCPELPDMKWVDRYKGFIKFQKTYRD